MTAPATTRRPGGRPRKAPEGREAAAALRAVGRTAQAIRAAEVARDDAIRAAVAAGWGHQAIADEADLSKGRIGQIAGPA
jgi:hypothetical protein